jgi:hypothetical protein
MAVRKLSLPLFSAKTLDPQPGFSTHYLHFIAAILLCRIPLVVGDPR